jgi:uncharacterized protein YydD (DUF2326 family)
MSVVLANRSKDSDENESTNGLGKTTLLRIMTFVIGSDLSRDKVLSHPDLAGVEFGIDLELAGKIYSAGRNTSTPGTISVDESFIGKDCPEEITFQDSRAILTVEAWRRVLALRFMPNALVSKTPLKFSPTFREVAPYFIRLGKEAFLDPQQAIKNQPGPSKRLITSYLLDLNWAEQRKLQTLLAERDRVTAALTALSEADKNTNEQSLGDLEAERVVLERALTARLSEVENFNLRSDYHDLEERLNNVDRTLHDLINDNYSDRRLLEHYELSAKDVPLFDANQPVNILRDAGAVFNADALRSINEIAAFHEEVYRNRAQFLKGEISRLRGQIEIRQNDISAASRDKQSVLQILSSSGALETLVALQQSSNELKIALESLKARIEERKRFDRRKDDIGAELVTARRVLKQDLDDRRVGVDEAIGLFATYTRWLYGISGKLGIDVGPAGYRFTFSIERQGSDGVDQMVVFCFDLMVATLRARRGAKFNTLIHDSSLFADVDPRQFGLALQLAASTSKTEGFQYICCLNEGVLPKDHLGELDLTALIKLRLHDDGDDGRLLGKRLPPRERK